MKLELLTPDDDSWQTFLECVPHDFYHLPGYVRLAAAQDNGQAEAVLITEGGSYFFLPYIVESFARIEALPGTTDQLHDIKSPYGYPCPLLREDSAGFLRAAITQWADAMRERGTVSGFFRLHPLFLEHIESLQTVGSLVRRGTTVAIDLTSSAEEIWRRVRRNHQRNIEQARQQGFTVTMDCGTEGLEDFEPIYWESMDRVGANASYYFPPSYFRELSAALGNRLWTCTARRPEGDAAASILLVESGPIVQYHLGGTRTAALALTPTKLLFDHAWRWAKARGRRVLHLGGGVGGAEDSLFYFKAGFSDQRLPFFTWQIVFLEKAYRSLDAHRRQMQRQATRPEFFPAYRA
jgi:hypothetical protein